MPSKKQRAKDTASVSKRFPKGGKDTLGDIQPLGNAFRHQGGMTGSIRKPTNPKRWSVK